MPTDWLPCPGKRNARIVDPCWSIALARGLGRGRAMPSLRGAMADRSGKPQTIGIWMTSALVVGTMIGAGIFMLPVSLAPLGGNALDRLDHQRPRRDLHRLRAWPAVAARRRRHPGQYRAGVRADGRLPRRLGFWVSNWVAQAAVAIAAASALSFVGPHFGGPGMIVSGRDRRRRPATARQCHRRARRGGLLDRHRGDQAAAAAGGDLDLRAARRRAARAFEPLPPRRSTFGNIAAATALTFFALTGFETRRRRSTRCAIRPGRSRGR